MSRLSSFPTVSANYFLEVSDFGDFSVGMLGAIISVGVLMRASPGRQLYFISHIHLILIHDRK